MMVSCCLRWLMEAEGPFCTDLSAKSYGEIIT